MPQEAASLCTGTLCLPSLQRERASDLRGQNSNSDDACTHSRSCSVGWITCFSCVAVTSLCVSVFCRSAFQQTCYDTNSYLALCALALTPAAVKNADRVPRSQLRFRFLDRFQRSARTDFYTAAACVARFTRCSCMWMQSYA